MRVTRPVVLLTAALTAAAVTLTACGGGSSDTVGASSGGGSGAVTLNLVAYSVPKVGFAQSIPAFQAAPSGAGVTFAESYGPSGDQSRKVEAGAPADVVTFSVEPDVTRLVKAGVVDQAWSQDGHGGIAFGSVVTMVVRQGNPLGIKDWGDLLRPGLEVVTPNPLSSGSAKWNLLAP